ncbi:MAG TPA: hypothetical protein VGW40_00105 [Allosphingosinicella sp.]|nr:hypothetical protein [Allosphingosinicella sp.]
MARLLVLIALLAAPASAQDPPPPRESQLTVYGDDPCPRSTDEEIVVCHRRPEEERYRIPAPLRRSSRNAEQAWTSRVEGLEETARDARPGSCSVVGSFGQSGCTQALIRQWYEARRARRSGGE